VNIIARAKVLGGRAEISSEVGQGTTVEMRVPLNRPLP
jgi:signal transduction histidine kinase